MLDPKIAKYVTRQRFRTRIYSIVLAVGGTVALVLPAAAGIAFEWLVAWLLLFSGIFQFIAAFVDQMKDHFFGKLLWATLFIGAGLWLSANPVLGVATLAVTIGILFIFEGAVRLTLAWRTRGRRDNVLMWVAAAASLAIAALLFVAGPLGSATVVGLLVGVNLLSGAALIWILPDALQEEST